jgi:hypothetical protein
MTLSRNLGTLTRRWVVSLLDTRLTPCALTTLSLRLPHVRSSRASRGLSAPKPTFGSSTARNTSSEICLRTVSAGTSYFQSRLDFHPYTQVNPEICTSSRLRSSTPLSKGFDLPRNRSAGFGYRGPDSRRAHPLPRKLRRFGFPSASPLNGLTSPGPGTPWPIFRNGRYNTAYAFMPYQSVANWFHVLFTSRQGYFAAFTHATTALSVSGSV